MGLDVYVGSLTRYYSGQWETVVQQWGRQEGVKVDVRRQNDPPDAITDPAEVTTLVEAWRKQLAASLPAEHAVRFDWKEGLDGPYFTDKPAWDCYAALLLWAAYDEHPDVPRAPVAPDDWSTDPAYARSTAPGFRSRYGQLLYDVEMWLPVPFQFTFKAAGPAGKAMGFGSSHTLLDQLEDLNARTWRADEAAFAQWRKDGADHGAPLETSARLALSIFRSLASASVEHRLPMLLDY